MSSAEVEIHLAEGTNNFHIKMTLSDPDVRAKVLKQEAVESAALLMTALQREMK